MHYIDCDGTYECEADDHEVGCLSHTIDPPDERALTDRGHLSVNEVERFYGVSELDG